MTFQKSLQNHRGYAFSQSWLSFRFTFYQRTHFKLLFSVNHKNEFISNCMSQTLWITRISQLVLPACFVCCPLLLLFLNMRRDANISQIQVLFTHLALFCFYPLLHFFEAQPWQRSLIQEYTQSIIYLTFLAEAATW